MGAPIRLERTLLFGEADPAGTIYTPNAIDIGIQAIERGWNEAMGISFSAFHATRRIGTPWVKACVTFSKPLLAGEAFALEMWIARFGESSVTWNGRAVDGAGAALFELDMVSVCIDAATGRKMPVPADLRGKLSRYLVESRKGST
jgi:4-hydroxybenzoyl-CoA thioesterase